MKTRIVTILVHITAWVIFLSLPYIFRPRPMLPEGIIEHHELEEFLRYFVFNVFLISIFYFHAYWMLPKLLWKKQMLYYIILILVLFIIFMLLREMLFLRLRPRFMGLPPGRQEFEIFRPDRLDSMFLFVVIMVISAGIWIVQEWMQAEKKSKQIESERIAMELSFLRSQINPHFMFNTLNSIYSLALVKSDMTADAVIKLSDMMRYLIQDSDSDKVPLEKELEYLSHYVELQRIRLGGNINVTYHCAGNPSGYQIPPLILMPFVENAFKYGISSHEPAPVIIDISVADRVLNLSVSNRIFTDRPVPDSSGLGIRNTRQRLEMIYPGHYSLDITENQKMYKINLMIHLV